MALNNMLTPMIESVKQKIKTIQNNHKKYATSVTGIKNVLSIDYTTIKMPKECKNAQIYYSGEIVAAYRKMLDLYDKAMDDRKLVSIRTYCDTLSVYVNGWNHMKIITEQNLSELSYNINRRLGRINGLISTFDKLMEEFCKINSEDTAMVDHYTFALYRYTTEFPYRKAYTHFFKKQRVSDFGMTHQIENDIKMLDECIELLNILYAGWDKTGKGESFEQYRQFQRTLIAIIQIFADLVEADINLCERFIQLNETVINFKVYPLK